MKRLWKNQEIVNMDRTMDTLRRMRTAAVMDKPTLFLRVQKYLRKNLGEIVPPQEALSEAEKLADAAGDFFAARLTKAKRKTEFDKWQDLLTDAQKKYTLYRATTFADTSLLESVGNSLIGRMHLMDIDPKYCLDRDLLQNNNFGAGNIKQLARKNIGVFSPLSGDYLMASTYSSYLRRTEGRTFPTRAAALSRDLSKLVLPLDNNRNLPFLDKPEIGIYIDTTDTGKTSIALFEGLQKMYPEKSVHRPTFERTQFQPSEKIRQFWERRE